MITGYNTDIEFDGVVYHVQTEDKGAATPVIMSLVYNRGTILASKRAPYDDLINGTVDEEAVAERLQRQHKLICAAVSAGRIEDLKQMSARNLKTGSAAKKNGKKRSAKAEPPVEQVELVAEVPDAPAAPPGQKPAEETKAPETVAAQFADGSIAQTVVEPPVAREGVEDARPHWPGPANQSAGYIPDTIPYFRLQDVLDPPTEDLTPISKPVLEPLPPPVKPPEPVVEEQVIEEVAIVTDEPIMISVDAVEAVSDLAGSERPENNKLNIDIIGETRFKGGEQKEVFVMVCRGSLRKVVPHAEVMLKVLGSDFRPVIYHAITDNNGIATVSVTIPGFQSGRASMIARAISDGEEVEVRSAIAHG